MKKQILNLLLLLTILKVEGQRYTVIIHEFMADPSPTIALPNNEWIEIKNISPSTINLQGWRIGDGSTLSAPLPNYLLRPDSLLLISSSSALPAMIRFGPAVSVSSFPAIDNAQGLLLIQDQRGLAIHALTYSDSWYRNELKKEGGWSLEMIDDTNFCSGSMNWIASKDPTGGTPGRPNSAAAPNPDLNPPRLLQSYAVAGDSIVLLFDEPIDSASASLPANYKIDNGRQINKAIVLSPSFDRVCIITDRSLTLDLVYTIAISGIYDCTGNRIVGQSSTKAGLPRDPLPGDLVINELLFDPRPNGYDYAELYNSSTGIFDLSRLLIANRNSNGILASIKLLDPSPCYLFPGDYIVVTENSENLAMNYLVKDPAHVLALKPLPSMPDDKGTLVLLNYQGEMVDEVNYSADWHFKLLNDKEGVSLERINASSPSNERLNWHSAASTAGYGTPGYKNSQFIPGDTIQNNTLSVAASFSPDNDGIDDVLQISYRLASAGFVANVRIYDPTGRLVKTLVNNLLPGITGAWNWDGLDDRGRRVPCGNYIILSEFLKLDGKRMRYKHTAALTQNFR